MSSGTNKERLTQNNAKIEELIELVKTKGSGSSSSASGAIIRTAELANIDITLSKDGTTIETKNTGAGGKVDFTVGEVGTYMVSTSTWSKEVVVEELNTIVKAYAGDLANYNEHQIHEACQGGYASLMWKPKDQWTYPNDSSIYANQKVMIISIRQVEGKEQIKWCLADKLSASYDINPRFAYLTSSTASSWTTTFSNNGGMKYSAMEQRFKLQGEEVYSQARGLLPESSNLGTGVKPSNLYYTDQNGVLCKVYDYDKATDSFVEAAEFTYASSSDAQQNCKFIKGYFKSVGTIDEQTFNSGYYYTYNSVGYYYTRAAYYDTRTTYYGLYETLQKDGVLVPQTIRPYLVKEERKASAGGTQTTYLSSFTDYANLLAIEEITGVNRNFTSLGGKLGTSLGFFNLSGEGEKEEGFDYITQLTGNIYWARSAGPVTAYLFYYIDSSGKPATNQCDVTYGVRVCYTTN